MENFFRPNPNSFKNTFCVFSEIPVDTVNGMKIQYDSKSGSKYYYTNLGMYRLSNHWGRLANSKWRLEPLEPPTLSKIKLGFASWDHFYPDNAVEELYYLEVNFSNKTVNYQHKNNPVYDKKAILRTSFETSKRIKQVRNLLTLTSWARYFDCDDIDLLRQQIINELLFTTKTLEEIKKEFH
ncbi:hypothetical protein [Flavobacterium sandaracinum]|uniref:Uncharacterized protein n=1 Tax=Flavobacterium sandaracinum TaxID=2541733 RepID=A0A4R5CR76_9FLAO|nr:hypothetical protein [Flavobacterium sandaracinum]TDE03052.1 hypothetical protein E0F91_11785 [Flavobacterium sandaracinum]